MAERVGERLFTGRKFTVDRMWVTNREGEEVPRERVTHPGSVVLLPMLDDEHVVFIRNHRYTLGRALLELPAGTLEVGEDRAVCALRELEEETGFTASDWTALSWTFPNPALQANKLFMFVARGCEKTSVAQLDPLEDCEVELVKYRELAALLARGEIRHALVLVALYELLLADRGLDVSAP